MIRNAFLLFIVLAAGAKLQAQDSLRKTFTIQEIFDLTLKNSQALHIGRKGVEVAAQRAEAIQTARLPGLTTSVSAGYIGNASIINKDFSHSTTVHLPHFANSFGVQASQLLFKGGYLGEIIATATLQQQVASLNLEENTLAIKLLVAANYFDLYKLYNQRNVYTKNLELATLRLEQINKLYNQGMVTRNDIVRSELQIANIRMAMEVLDNNMNIINKQLTTVAGLDDRTIVVPDTTSKINILAVADAESYQSEAQQIYPGIKLARTNVELSEKAVKIARTDLLPSVSLYAGSSLARPITTSNPAMDKYSGGRQLGVSISYNIASLYTAPKNIKTAQLQSEQAKETELLTRQNRTIAVNASYIKHQESISLRRTLKQSVRLADENYRIIEKKYLNQLALLIDMLDAANSKLDAELLYANAEIDIVFTYFQLLRETGRL